MPAGVHNQPFLTATASASYPVPPATHPFDAPSKMVRRNITKGGVATKDAHMKAGMKRILDIANDSHARAMR
eukprot:1155240-Pelagomonas_calceolata.AAC.1